MISWVITRNRVADASQTHVEDITWMVRGRFRFSTSAMGGFATAQLELACDEATAWRLLNDYMGNRIVAYEPTAPDMVAWEGMIYTVAIDDGRMAITRSMANVYNQVRVVYSTVDTSTTPPTLGIQERTADANYAAGQASVGIRELTYVIGGATAESAANLRNVLLTQYRLAQAVVSQSEIGGDADMSAVRVTLDCVGWWETLDKRFYTQTSLTAPANLDVILKAVLAGVGQFVDSDHSGINVNTRQRSRYIDAQITAQKLIASLCALGGSSNARWYFQLWENARPYYYEEPSTVTYYTRRLDPNGRVYDASGRWVPPWLVRAGQIIEVADMLPDEASYSSWVANSRRFLIGETLYTAPHTLTLLPQAADPSQLSLARMGLSQIG